MSVKAVLSKAWAFTQRHYRIGCEIVAIGAALMVFYFMGSKLTGMHGLMTNDKQPLFGDFIAFWSAGKLVLAGKVAQVHDTHQIHLIHLSIIPHLPVVAGWNSPPQFLLIAVLLALIPYFWSAITFLIVSFAIYFIAARKILPDWRALIFAATVPAALYEIGSVQTGIIIAGITGLALYWQDRRPLSAGALLAILTIKPHMALLWPIYLALTGRWRMFISAAVACTIVTLLAGFVYGFDAYIRFFNNLAYTQRLISDHHVSPATYGSLYGNLLSLKVPNNLALAAHAASAAAALVVAGIVWFKGEPRIQGAALCAATMLTSPYLFFYDTTLLALGAALLGAPKTWWQWPGAIFGWAAGFSVLVGFYIHLPIAPFAAWMVLLSAAGHMFKSAESAATRRLAVEPSM